MQDFQPQEVLLAEFNPILERKRNNGEENIVSGLGKHTPIYVLEKIYPNSNICLQLDIISTVL